MEKICNISADLGVALNVIREIKNIPKKEFAKALGVKIDAYNRFTVGEQEIPLFVIDKLCVYLNINAITLMQILHMVRSNLWDPSSIRFHIEHILVTTPPTSKEEEETLMADITNLSVIKSLVTLAHTIAVSKQKNSSKFKDYIDKLNGKADGWIWSYWNINRNLILDFGTHMREIEKHLTSHIGGNLAPPAPPSNDLKDDDSANLRTEAIDKEQRELFMLVSLPSIKITVAKRTTIKPGSSPVININENVIVPPGYYATFCLRNTHAKQGLIGTYFELPSGWSGTPSMTVVHAGVVDIELLAGDKLGQLHFHRN